MLSGAYLLLLSGAFLALRLSGNAGSFPRPLSAAAERELVERSMAGDLEARNRLIEHNLRLVAHIIKKYYTSAEDTEDLISIGTIGLIKGVNTYRPDKGVRLATYAARCVENEILMYFRSLKKSISGLPVEKEITIRLGAAFPPARTQWNSSGLWNTICPRVRTNDRSPAPMVTSPLSTQTNSQNGWDSPGK